MRTFRGLANRAGGQRGLTLVESIVALGLFGIATSGFLGLMVAGVDGAGAAGLRSTAFQLARSQIESIQFQPYAEPISYTTVTAPDDDFLITIGGAVLTPGFLEQIDVTVEFPSGEVILSGYKYNDFPPVLAEFPLDEPAPVCPVGKVCTAYYLHNIPSPPISDTLQQVNLPMSTSTQAAFVRFNYDTDADNPPASAGRDIQKGGDVDETNPDQYLNWRTPPLAADTHLDGDVELHLWTASDEFAINRRGEIEVFLRDFDGVSNYTELGSVSIFRADWQAGFQDFIIDVYTFLAIDHVVLAGHQIELKIITGAQTQTPRMMYMYDYIDFDSKLFITVSP